MNEYLHQAQTDAVENHQPFCLIMADIDDFKKMNDTYGHAAGDEVLVQVAKVLSENIREEDCVCRWGGEEMLILVHSDKAAALQVAERIKKQIEELIITHENISLSVTLTIGVAQHQTGDSIRAVVDKADQRLYYGKEHGKNQVVTD